MASTITIAALPRITASALSSIILTQSPTPSPNPAFAIIDVRDDDHIGGHILGSTHVPSRTLDREIPKLVRQLQDKETVVFHCALSQQRGPSAALRYIRERQRLLSRAVNVQRAEDDMPDAKKEDLSSGAEGKELGNEEGAEGAEGVTEQKVFVLDRGFVGWQERFAEDERLTEGYRREIWKDGYWM